MVHSHGLSAAIFAQGWTYETQKDFVDAESKMWSSFHPYLTHRGPGQLPLRTSFCQGHGHAQYADGKVGLALCLYQVQECGFKVLHNLCTISDRCAHNIEVFKYSFHLFLCLIYIVAVTGGEVRAMAQPEQTAASTPLGAGMISLSEASYSLLTKTC